MLTEKSQKLNRWLITLSLLLLIFGILLLIFRKRLITFFARIQDPAPKDEEVQEVEDLNPIVDFYKEVKKQLPDRDEISIRYLVAQAMHETGLFKSKLYKEHNNAFGMMFPRIRQNVAHSPTNTGYAHYNTVADSIKDMDLYLKYVEMPLLSEFPEIKDYAKALKAKAYYTDTILIYGNALHSHFNNLKTILQ